MILGLVAALAAAVAYGVASVLQAVGSRRLATAAPDARLLLRLLRSAPYVAGLALDAAGVAATVVALRVLPLFVVESAVASSVGVTALVAARWLGARLRRPERIALVVLGVGLVLLASSAEAEGGQPLSRAWQWVMLALSLVVAAAARAAPPAPRHPAAPPPRRPPGPPQPGGPPARGRRRPRLRRRRDRGPRAAAAVALVGDPRRAIALGAGDRRRDRARRLRGGPPARGGDGGRGRDVRRRDRRAGDRRVRVARRPGPTGLPAGGGRGSGPDPRRGDRAGPLQRARERDERPVGCRLTGPRGDDVVRES